MRNLYMPQIATVDAITDETPQIKTLTLTIQNGKGLNARPGQFIQLTIFGSGEFPVSIAPIYGTANKRFQTTVQKIGKVTKEIDNLSVGTKVGIRGPFGNGFPMEKLKGQDILLVTGGVGLSAMLHLIRHIMNKRRQYGKIKLLHGAKKPADIIYKDSDFLLNKNTNKNELDIALTVDYPDPGWQGHVGVVTDLLKATNIVSGKTVAVVCGPSIMMKFAVVGLIDKGLKKNEIFLSMERRMQCGIGLCGHCMIGPKRVCLDGPIFSFEELSDSMEKIF